MGEGWRWLRWKKKRACGMTDWTLPKYVPWKTRRFCLGNNATKHRIRVLVS